MKFKSKLAFAILLPFPVLAATTAVTTKAMTSANSTPAATASSVVASTLPQIGNFKFGAASAEKLNDVTLSDSAKVEVGGKTIELKRVTAGLRQKKVAIIWASVYVGQFFTNGKIDRSSVSALRESLLGNLPVVMSMTFVRSVGIDKIVDAYQEVFSENGIKSDAEPFAKFLAGVKASGDVNDKQTYWFWFSKNGDQEQMSFQTNGKEYFSLTNGGAGTLKNFLSMWLAKPADSGLEKLQDQFIAKDKN
jgi:hypothetical protein